MVTIVNHQESETEGIEKCPQCLQTPSLSMSDNHYVISCPHHGHMAMGSDLADATKYWNRYISFIKRDTYEKMGDRQSIAPQTSWCVHCEKNTHTLVKNTKKHWRADCLECRLLKFEKDL